MQYREIPSEEVKIQALRLLKRTNGRTVTMATWGADGYPDLRPLMLCGHDGLETLWFGTALATRKAAQLGLDPKCTIHGLSEDGGMEFRLFGTVQLLTDAASRRRIWQDGFLQYFPDGVDSPALGVLRFTSVRGEYRAFSETGPGMGTFSL